MAPTRRKSTKQQVEDSEEEESNETQRRNARMKNQHEEIFIKTCVENFEKINDKSTFRGVPGTKSYKKRQAKIDETWENITSAMNKITKVSLDEHTKCKS